MLSELCSIFKVDRYLKLAGAIFDSMYVHVFSMAISYKYTYQWEPPSRLEGGVSNRVGVSLGRLPRGDTCHYCHPFASDYKLSVFYTSPELELTK